MLMLTKCFDQYNCENISIGWRWNIFHDDDDDNDDSDNENADNDDDDALTLLVGRALSHESIVVANLSK